MRPSSSKWSLLPEDQALSRHRALILKKLFCPACTVRLSWLPYTDVISWILSEPTGGRFCKFKLFFFFFFCPDDENITERLLLHWVAWWNYNPYIFKLVEILLWPTPLCTIQPCRPTSCPEEEFGRWSSSSASSPPSFPPSWTTLPPWCSSLQLPSGDHQSSFLSSDCSFLLRPDTISHVSSVCHRARGLGSCVLPVDLLKRKKRKRKNPLANSFFLKPLKNV